MKPYEKEGVFTGAYCINPLTGRRMPVYAAFNFALMEYGTGAVAVRSAHDQRDFEFAQKYGLDIIVVMRRTIWPLGTLPKPKPTPARGYRSIPGNLTGWTTSRRRMEIADYLKPTISASGQSVSDSGTGAFSRQRFWGAPCHDSL
ncbi:MAG: class I tRNA ligase family protein [Desulfobacterales bacterium]